MKRLIASLISAGLIITLTSCGYDGGYRYECQDPANWEKADCNPPICEPSGTCSKDLVGEKVWSDYQASKGK